MLVDSRYLLVLLISVFILPSANAQNDEKDIIAIYDFSYNSDLVDTDLLPSLKQYVVSAFQNSGRFRILNRDSNEQMKKELALQKTRDYYQNAIVEQGKKLGAKYIVTGNVDQLISSKISKKTSNGPLVLYEADFSFLLTLIDIETNEILASEQMSVSGGKGLGSVFSGSSSSPIDAVNTALKKIDGKVKRFIENNFGELEAQIVEILETSGEEAAKVLISGGSNMKLKKGDKLTVYISTKTEFAGKVKTRKRHIGELKIELVEDSQFSICTVKDGGDAIAAEIAKGEIAKVFKKKKKIGLDALRN